jgi:8-oxo-dGTP pyrophosphatase MutT (NUDIX family)
MRKASETVTNLVRAAGGLVWRETAVGKEVLLVRRKRYGDWTLPKGKHECGESMQETACREVQEETGYDVQITGFAGAIAYEVEGKPKVVSFWHMKAVSDPTNQIDTEVAEVVWLLLDQALQLLDYPLEKALLDAWRAIDEEKIK